MNAEKQRHYEEVIELLRQLQFYKGAYLSLQEDAEVFGYVKAATKRALAGEITPEEWVKELGNYEALGDLEIDSLMALAIRDPVAAQQFKAFVRGMPEPRC